MQMAVIRPMSSALQVRKKSSRHRLRTIKAYDYRDAATLLEDFWTMVDTVLLERGVMP